MSNLIEVPVFADVVNQKLNRALKIVTLSTDYTTEVGDITLMGTEAHFPKLNRVVNMAKVTTNGTELTAGTVSLADTVAPIAMYAGDAVIYDRDVAAVKGSLIDRMAEQFADECAVVMDDALTATIRSEATKKSALESATAVTETELYNAYALFGDSVNVSDFAGIAISSHLLPSFYAMPSFVDATKTVTMAGNGIVQDNVIGYWLGIPVILDNSLYNTTTKEAQVVFVKKGALGHIMQKQPTIEPERQATFLRTAIVASEMFATKVMDTDGIVLCSKTIA